MRDCYTPTSVMQGLSSSARVPGSTGSSAGPARPTSRARPRRLAVGLLVAALTGLFAGSVRAQADSAAQSEQPPHYLLLTSAGVPMRLNVSDTYGQSRFAPAYANVLIGYALPGERFRHGFGLGVSWNLGHDGGYTDPIYAGDQIALMPAYLARYELDADVIGIGHLGVPILVRGGGIAGFEIGAALAYRLAAGLGVFSALNLDAYAGGTASVLASLELGVMIDYEVLP